ncbi:MAG: hypothetical protein GY893_09240, partial [bacterium]|nr:hypothetical protein [bacterium]
DFTEGGLGADHSGNYNYFTPNNLGTEDMVEDSPTNNFATLSSVWNSTGATFPLSEGNLKCAMTTSGSGLNGSTIAPESGKWYCEYLVSTLPGSDRAAVGIADVDGLFMDNNGNAQNIVAICTAANNRYWDFGTEHDSATGVSQVVANDIVQFAWDVDTGKVWIGINNTWQGTSSPNPATGTSPLATHSTVKAWAPILRFASGGSESFTVHFNAGQDSSFAGTKTAQGNQDGNDKGDFYYTPPSGFLALCTDNLDSPAIDLPSDHFNTVLYAGNGGTQSVTGAGFAPDFVWIKNRTDAVNHGLFDTIRGVKNSLQSNTTTEARTAAGATEDLYAFGSDGFSVGVGGGAYINCNESSKNYASWNWKAGGTASTNDDGSMDSEVSANPAAGFSIVSFPAGAAAAGNMTVGHGLSQAPTMIIVKNLPRDYDWNVYQADVCPGGAGRLILNSDAGVESGALPFNGVPTSSVFTFNNGFGSTEDDEIIAYCFHSVEGYSKVGTYTGNGVADGTFVYTGFRPSWLMIKYIDGGSGYSWQIADNKRNTYNVVDTNLLAESNSAEGHTWSAKDFVSNGFKLRTTNSAANGSGLDFLYLAFAESPFKTSNAR